MFWISGLEPSSETTAPSYLKLVTVPNSAVKVHDSQAYRNMEMTRELISFTFDPRGILLSVEMGFSFVRAAVACAVLEKISGLEPSSETTALKYLKLVTVPSFCSFTFISLNAIVISLVFSALISIVHLVHVLSRLSIRASRSCRLPPMLTFPSCSSRAPDMISLRKKLSRIGDRRHPCLTLTVALSHSPMLPFIWTALLALSLSCSMMPARFARILYFGMVAHKAAFHTLSKAFMKSVKTWFKFCWCWRYFSHRILRLKICCGAPSSSEFSLFFSNYLNSLGFKPIQDDFQFIMMFLGQSSAWRSSFLSRLFMLTTAKIHDYCMACLVTNTWLLSQKVLLPYLLTSYRKTSASGVVLAPPLIDPMGWETHEGGSILLPPSKSVTCWLPII